MKPRTIAPALVALLTLCAGGNCGDARSASTGEIKRAHFDTHDAVEQPIGYREWYHAGMRVKLDGDSILDHLPIKAPEFVETYIEPSALAAYRKTGKWPDGAQLVKEFSVVETGKNCDTKTLSCTTPFGPGIVQAGYVGLGMMVKDDKRFADHPGHWGFFNVGHRPPPYPSSEKAQPIDQCQACHSTVASDTDWVVSKAHIGLSERNSGD